MIRVEQASCAGGKTTLTLSQGEFTKDRPDKATLSWRVPVIAQVVGNRDVARTLVEGGHAKLDVPGCGPVVVNAGQAVTTARCIRPNSSRRSAPASPGSRRSTRWA
jgi:aminopeptidase N